MKIMSVHSYISSLWKGTPLSWKIGAEGTFIQDYYNTLINQIFVKFERKSYT